MRPFFPFDFIIFRAGSVYVEEDKPCKRKMKIR